MSDCQFQHKAFAIRVLYIVLCALWLILIAHLNVISWPMGAIAYIPVGVMAIGFISASYIEDAVENEMFNASYLSVGVIMLLPMLGWVSKSYQKNKEEVIRVIFWSMILTLASFVDVWLPKEWLCVYRHFQSALQTMSIVLLATAFLNLYITKGRRVFHL